MLSKHDKQTQGDHPPHPPSFCSYPIKLPFQLDKVP